MVKYIKVNKNGTITLPRETLKAFPAFSDLVLWWKGDSLVLKRVSASLPSEFAERTPKKGMSLREITKELQRARTEKRRG
jgi:hypothetical protein